MPSSRLVTYGMPVLAALGPAADRLALGLVDRGLVRRDERLDRERFEPLDEGRDVLSRTARRPELRPPQRAEHLGDLVGHGLARSVEDPARGVGDLDRHVGLDELDADR